MDEESFQTGAEDVKAEPLPISTFWPYFAQRNAQTLRELSVTRQKSLFEQHDEVRAASAIPRTVNTVQHFGNPSQKRIGLNSLVASSLDGEDHLLN